MVKEFLLQRGIGFEERDVSQNRSYVEELVKTSGQMGVPVTIIDGQIVVGFNRGRLDELLAQAQTGQHPSLGALIADADKIRVEQTPGITLGAYIGRVKTGSLAERIGLSAGDIIIELNSKHIANASELENALSRLSKGSRFSLVFLRGNSTMNAEGTF